MEIWLMPNKTSNESLKDFIIRESKNDKSQPTGLISVNNGNSVALSQSSVISITSKLSVFGLTKLISKDDEKEKFITGINTLIGEESTLDEISSVIEQPLPDETEDEFVKRAKSQISDVLFNLMSKK